MARSPNLAPRAPEGWAVGLAAASLVACYSIKPLPPGAALAPPSSFDGAAVGELREIAGVKLRWIPAGTFTMGSPPGEPERRPGEDQVQVMVSKGFWMGQFEVTQSEWARVVGSAPEEFNVGQGDAYPMYRVNYAEAGNFCHRLTDLAHASQQLPPEWEFRLPTEAQWEYAARGGTTTASSLGTSWSSTQANFLGRLPYNGGAAGPSLDQTTPVGRYEPNPWGLYDTCGNVNEWCRDWVHEHLPGGVDPDVYEVRGEANSDGTYPRARRGGCYADEGWPCRAAFRQRFEPERRHEHIGFRVVAVRP